MPTENLHRPARFLELVLLREDMDRADEIALFDRHPLKPLRSPQTSFMYHHRSLSDSLSRTHSFSTRSGGANPPRDPILPTHPIPKLNPTHNQTPRLQINPLTASHQPEPTIAPRVRVRGAVGEGVEWDGEGGEGMFGEGEGEDAVAEFGGEEGEEGGGELGVGEGGVQEGGSRGGRGDRCGG